MQILTHVAELDQIAEGLPAESWLSNAEWMHFAGLRQNHASLAWLGGRWCAKQLLMQWINDYSSEIGETVLSEFHIESRNGLWQSVAPRVLYRGRLKPWRLSISHGQNICAAAMAVDQSVQLGLDIVDTEADCGQIEHAWLSPQEQAWCAEGISPTVVWALKEATYKAIGNGGRFQPRKLDTSKWFRFEHLLRIAGSDPSPHAGLQFENSGRLHWQRYGRELLVMLEFVPARDNSKHTAKAYQQREAILQ